MTRFPLPPGQQLAAAHKWPFVGERAPGPGSEAWTLEIGGVTFSRDIVMNEGSMLRGTGAASATGQGSRR